MMFGGGKGRRGADDAPTTTKSEGNLAAFGNMDELIAEGRAESKRPIPQSKPADPVDQERLNNLNSQEAWARRRAENQAHAQRMAERRGQLRRNPTTERVQKYVDGLSDRMPGGEKTAARCKPMAPVFVALIYGSFYISKGVGFVSHYVFLAWELMPQTVLKIAYGLALCFFGGTFNVAIAATEAFYAAGWQRAYWSSLIVYDDARRIRFAIAEDDLVDADGDGVADVDQIGSKELVNRKVALAFRTIEDPEALQGAFGNVWAAYLAVLATLQFKFARTTAFAVGIASSSRFFFLKLLGPPLNHVMPADTEHWVPVMIDTFVHIVALVLAWYLQMVMSAVTSGLRGGTIAARAFLEFANERGWKKLDDEATSLSDETIGMIIAAGGICFQLLNNFALPFPANIILFPLTLVQWVLKWQITWG
mmetsp:Transcript_9780/g.25285  ORF Transcript_9780/g.25285 Transcript_9780/m.25285 type:complete len:422 (-) Transcript_9780:341-1606(-)